MLNFRRATILGTLVFTGTVLPAQIPKEMTATWSEFKAGLASNKPESIIPLVQFPLQVNDFSRSPISKSRFKSIYPSIFTPKVVALFQKAVPRRINGFRGILVDISDPDELPLALGFELVGNKYRLTYIDNANAESGWGRVPYK